MVEMIASMETYLRRGRRTCQRLLLNPKIRTGGVVLLCGGSGFLLSAASLGNYPQPLAMGLILAMSGWHAAVMSLGAMLGYWVFWGIAGLQGWCGRPPADCWRCSLPGTFRRNSH